MVRKTSRRKKRLSEHVNMSKTEDSEKGRRRTNQHCCVPLCTNDTRYCEKGEISFHHFPSEEALRKKWIAKIRRDIGPDFKVGDQITDAQTNYIGER
jgi:hypothetical protein